MKNTPEQNKDDLTLKAQEACAESVERTPEKSDWGMYSYSDAPAAVGGGFGAFQWFSSYENLQDFLKTHFMFQTPHPWGAQFEDNLKNFHDLINQTSGREDLNDCLPKINILLKRYYVIEWVGIFQSLCSSNYEFPTKVRNEYRTYLDGMQVADSSSIQDHEIEQFVNEILSQYGL